MPNFSGVSQGFLDFNKDQATRAHQAQQEQYMAALGNLYQTQNQAQIARLNAEQEAQRRLMAARQGLPDVLSLLYGGGGGGPGMGAPAGPLAVPPPIPEAAMPQPPAPGQNSMTPGPGAPSAGPPPPPGGGAPVVGGPMDAAPSLSWRPLPPGEGEAPAAPAAPPGPGMIEPPPKPAAAAAGAGAQKAELQVQDLGSIVQALQKTNVPKDQWMDMIDLWVPHMSAEAKQAINTFKVQNQALAAGMQAATAVLNANTSQRRAATAERVAATGERVAESTIDVNRTRKAKLLADINRGAKEDTVKIVRWATNDEGLVVGGYDRAGHFHEVTEKPSAPPPKAGAKEQRNLANLKETRRSMIARGLSAKDPRITELDTEIEGMERGGGKAAPDLNNIAAKVRAAGAAYEPDKFIYRINPANGQVEKKAKGG